MKYSLHNEMLATSGYQGDTQLVESDAFHRTLNLVSSLARYLTYIILKPFDYLIRLAGKYYSSYEFIDDNHEAYEIYEKMSHRRVPNCLWNRHSALLYETEIKNIQNRARANISSSPIEEKSIHINVSSVEAVPVWASNLEDIGVITRQI